MAVMATLSGSVIVAWPVTLMTEEGGMGFCIKNSIISWASQKQKSVTLLSCEAEFMAATTAACQVIWLRKLMNEVTEHPPQAVKLYVDNKSQQP